MTIGKTDKQIEIWKTMDTSSNDLSYKNLVINKLIQGKTGFRATRYAAEYFGIRPSLKFIDDNKDIKFKDKLLKHIFIFSEEYLQINGPKILFDNTRIRNTQNNLQYLNANELKQYIENKSKCLKSLSAVPIILVSKCINILFLKF